MGFFNKLKETIKETSKKVGKFMKDAFAESEEQAKERRAKEAEEKAKQEAIAKEQAKANEAEQLEKEKKAKEAEQKALEEKRLIEEKVKLEIAKKEMEKEKQQKKLESMFVEVSDEKKIDIKALLRKIGAMDDDEIYIAGISSLKDESSMSKVFKKDKDKTALSVCNGHFYISRYTPVDKKFKATKTFAREDVGSVEISTKTLEKRLEIRDKEKFYIIRIDVTDNGSSLQSIEKMLK